MTNQTDVFFEQPLNERLRLFLRLETLFRDSRAAARHDGSWASRAALQDLCEILLTLARNNVKQALIQNLDRQLVTINRTLDIPEADTDLCLHWRNQLQRTVQQLHHDPRQLDASLRHDNFLESLRHRNVGASTSDADTPALVHWLHQPGDERRANIDHWLGELNSTESALALTLKLTRQGSESSNEVAENGFFQRNLPPPAAQLVRIGLLPGSTVFPEISASRHRLSVRFLYANYKPNQRSGQAQEAVRFRCSICQL